MNNNFQDFRSSINRMNSDSLKWDGVKWRFGKFVFPMWVADMDLPVADCIVRALEERVRHPVFGYPDHDDSVQVAAASWMNRRHQWTANPDSFILLSGVVPGLYAAVRAITKPGDNVIVMTPIYPPFMSSITENERVLLNVPLLYGSDGNYSIDFNSLDEAMKKSKVMMFCSPHNPIGRTWSYNELQKLIDLAQKNKVLIISDEIHADLSYENYQHFPLPLLYNNCIFLGSATKSFNIAGIGGGVAWVGNPEIKKLFVKELSRSRLLGMTIFAKIANTAAWLNGYEWQSRVRDYFLQNAEYIKERLSITLPDVGYRIPENSYLAWLNLKAYGFNDADIEKKLIEVGLGLNLGITFGSGGSGFVRLNFGTSFKNLEKGLSLLEEAFKHNTY